MRTGPSLQRKDPDRGTPHLQTPNCNPSLLSKLILAPAIWTYFATAFFTSFMSKRRDAKTVISSAYADTFVLKGIPRRAGLAFSSLSLRSRGSQEEEQPYRTGSWIMKFSECFLLICTTACGFMVHYASPSVELWFESGGLENSRHKPMVNLIEGLGLIKIDQRSFSAVF